MRDSLLIQVEAGKVRDEDPRGHHRDQVAVAAEAGVVVGPAEIGEVAEDRRAEGAAAIVLSLVAAEKGLAAVRDDDRGLQGKRRVRRLWNELAERRSDSLGAA